MSLFKRILCLTLCLFTVCGSLVACNLDDVPLPEANPAESEEEPSDGSSGNKKPKPEENIPGDTVVGEPELSDDGLSYLLLADGTYAVQNGALPAETTELIIPATYKGKAVSRIAKDAFKDISEIRSVTLPEGIVAIDDRAFEYCDRLNTITFPQSLKIIGKEAFHACQSLEQIHLPGHLTTIRSNAFINTGYDQEPSNWENGVLYIGPYLITAVNLEVNDYTVKEGTRLIADSAFESNTNLYRLTIPEGVTTIGESALTYCRYLEEIQLPGSLVSIEKTAFYNCSSLKTLSLPYGINTVCEGAFRYCTELSQIILPTSLTTIHSGAFDGCSSLAHIYFAGSELEWNAIEKSGANIPSSTVIHYAYENQMLIYRELDNGTYEVTHSPSNT